MLIGICEDNQEIRKEIKHEIEQRKDAGLFQILTFSSGEEMLTANEAFDLVFLDIELSGILTGLDVAQRLQNELPDIIIVFISGYTKYITSSFHLHAFQFLLKPLETSLFQEEFDRCLLKYKSSHSLFRINQSGEVIDIELREIMYIESKKRKLLIYLRNGRCYEIYGKISECEEKLAIYYFVRIHKSYLINCYYVKKMNETVVLLKGQKPDNIISLPISRSYKGNAKEQYKVYCLELGR